MATLTAMLLVGCGSEQRIDNTPGADINAAAEAAQGDIDTYAANALEPAPPPLALTRIPDVPSPGRPMDAADAGPPANGQDAADDIEGATPPRPDESVAATDMTYRCAGTTRISVRFDRDADTATIRRGEREIVLDGQRPASGIWYKGGGYELRGTGRSADYTAPDRAPAACTAD